MGRKTIPRTDYSLYWLRYVACDVMKICIISDLHLSGSYKLPENTDVSVFTEFLTEYATVNFDLIIFAGDIFDAFKVSKEELLVSYPQFIGLLRDLNYKDNFIHINATIDNPPKTVYLAGNHDAGFLDFQKEHFTIINQDVYNDKEIKTLVVHGHQFDEINYSLAEGRFKLGYGLLELFNDSIYKLGKKTLRTNARHKNIMSKAMSWLSGQTYIVENNTIQNAVSKMIMSDSIQSKYGIENINPNVIDTLILGHTHMQDELYITDDEFQDIGKAVISTGSWTNEYSHIIIIDEYGVELTDYYKIITES